MYETFDHTADLGLRIRAADRDTLFAESGRGLCSIFVDNVEDVRAEREVPLHIEGTETDFLLFDWLNELLFQFESERLLLAHFDVHVTDEGLNATARGEEIDPDRHRLAHEVKAITYHRLDVRETPEGWQAEVIVDI